jgi:branched-subunit amino acid aminotransferase/4-amino-4-deoxychorismate lyase
LKCRSRIHYYLADRKAALAEPGARALLLDQQGHVVESSTANVVLFRSTEGFLSPPRENILPGVSLAVLEELARGMGLAMIYRDLTPEDVLSADEVMLTSTSPCLVPVVSLNREPVAGGAPGPMFRRTMAAWSKLVGLDIAQQARNFCRRESG